MNVRQRQEHFRVNSACALLLQQVVGEWEANRVFTRAELDAAILANAEIFLGVRRARITLRNWALKGELANTLINMRQLGVLVLVERNPIATETRYKRGPKFGVQHRTQPAQRPPRARQAAERGV